MFTIPNQSSVAKSVAGVRRRGADEPSGFRERVVDVMEELFRFTIPSEGPQRGPVGAL